MYNRDVIPTVFNTIVATTTAGEITAKNVTKMNTEGSVSVFVLMVRFVAYTTYQGRIKSFSFLKNVIIISFRGERIFIKWGVSDNFNDKKQAYEKWGVKFYIINHRKS